MSTTPNTLTPLASDWHRVGAGLSVRFSFKPTALQLGAEWNPRPPTRREWKRVIERYRSARDKFLGVVAGQLGGAIACVEVGP